MIVVTGVFNSWDAFATKSRLTAAERSSAEMSSMTRRTRPSSAKGNATSRSLRTGFPCSISRSTRVRASIASRTTVWHW